MSLAPYQPSVFSPLGGHFGDHLSSGPASSIVWNRNSKVHELYPGSPQFPNEQEYEYESFLASLPGHYDRDLSVDLPDPQQQFSAHSRQPNSLSSPIQDTYDDSGADFDPAAFVAATLGSTMGQYDYSSEADLQPKFTRTNNASLNCWIRPQHRRPIGDIFSNWEAPAERSVSPLSPNNESWTTYNDISRRANDNDGSLLDQSPVFFEHEAFPGAGHLTPPPICSNISRSSYKPVSLPQSWRTSVPPRKPVPWRRPISPYKPGLPPKPLQYMSIGARTSLSPYASRPTASSPYASSPTASSPTASSPVDSNSAGYDYGSGDLTGRHTLPDTNVDLSANLYDGCSSFAVSSPGLPFKGSDYQAQSVLPDTHVEPEPYEKPSAWEQCRKLGQSLMSRVSTMTGANSERWFGR